MLKLGIVGAGCIGRRIAQAVVEGELLYAISTVCDIDKDAAGRFRAELAPDSEHLPLEQATAACDVLVECASGSVVGAVLEAATNSWEHNSAPGHVLVMSVGGLLGQPLESPGPVIHVPAGAIGGLDAIAAMSVAGLDEVNLTTRKPPGSLGLDCTEETVLFDGPACDVIEKYPKNINVAMALSLAGLGPHKTRVKLVADPAISLNTHHVKARGPAGEIEFVSRNQPFPENPRTSYLAALSAVAVLKRMQSTMQIG